MISVLCHTLHMNSISLIWKNSILCLRFVLTLLSIYVPLIVLEKVNKLDGVHLKLFILIYILKKWLLYFSIDKARYLYKKRSKFVKKKNEHARYTSTLVLLLHLIYLSYLSNVYCACSFFYEFRPFFYR
jgi:hypothetical protein